MRSHMAGTVISRVACLQLEVPSDLQPSWPGKYTTECSILIIILSNPEHHDRPIFISNHVEGPAYLSSDTTSGEGLACAAAALEPGCVTWVHLPPQQSKKGS
jgi:hypothetical protein